MTLRAATRGSALARRQTEIVADMLDVEVEPVVISTVGDRDQDVPIHAMGGQGVFVKEVQAAVLDGRADVAVHSAKDLPSITPDGLVMAAVPERGDVRDALVGGTLEGLAVAAMVATGSVRRRAQLSWLRPDLTFTGLRGNIDTRLAKAAGVDAIVVAAAALDRVGRSDVIAELLDVDLVLPQVGQGALAIECRADDVETRRVVGRIEHAPSRRAVDCERAYLAAIGGGCDLPVGAYATEQRDGSLLLRAVMASLDGRVLLRHADEGGDPAELGARVARHLLDGAGGRALLDDLLPMTRTEADAP
ncbi:MAG: hydroxymethylbilane synthase [Acidimicrobiales bacterium]|nr:hydroxymethylbilane synthase [Acidimicrobiales bacterium]